MFSKNTLLPVQSTLQSRGRLLSLDTPVVMGILNVTPDSFYNKGRDSDMASVLRNAEQMLKNGAAILDVGGASTRPGAQIINVQEELDRVIPIIEEIYNRFPDAWISADTYHAAVAREAVIAGAAIVNDVSGGHIDPDMLHTVASLKVPYIAMHMPGTPATMQQDPTYNDVVKEVRNYLARVAQQCREAGITDIIIDPGFGFGKTLTHNFQLLKQLHTLKIAGLPVLAGISRKSIVCKPLEVKPEDALNGTTALHMVALQQGASILRAHDVKEAVQVIKLYQLLEDTGN